MDVARPPRSPWPRRLAIAAGVAAVIAVSVKLATMKPADPVVSLSTVWPDSVRRGDMVREVHSSGTLVPEQIRLITALTSGRVERVLAQTGQEITPETVLLEMSNPDQQIQTMQMEQQLRAAESALLRMRSSRKSDSLSALASLTSARNLFAQAKREADAEEDLFAKKLTPLFAVMTKREQLQDATIRLQTEEAKAALSAATSDAEIKVQEGVVEQTKLGNALQQTKVRGLSVHSAEGGVLQDLTLQLGQWVPEGTMLAKVVQPGKLKAVLRIPESQAKDVQLGQKARIDTRNGIVEGHVSRKDPSAQAGTVTMDVALDGPLPAGAVPDLSVEGTIEIEKLTDVLFTGRPSSGAATGPVGLFKIVEDGKAAVRVQVELGRSSVNLVEIVRGLQAGDRVILSPMDQWDQYDRVRLKQE